jgi:hypothetical protein
VEGGQPRPDGCTSAREDSDDELDAAVANGDMELLMMLMRRRADRPQNSKKPTLQASQDEDEVLEVPTLDDMLEELGHSEAAEEDPKVPRLEDILRAIDRSEAADETPEAGTCEFTALGKVAATEPEITFEGSQLALANILKAQTDLRLDVKAVLGGKLTTKDSSGNEPCSVSRRKEDLEDQRIPLVTKPLYIRQHHPVRKGQQFRIIHIGEATPSQRGTPKVSR